MAVLARKVTRAKWEQRPELPEGSIAADAVTVDLKTTGNRLSFWRCESSNVVDLERAVLALAAAAERPDRIDVVYLDEEAVRAEGLPIQSTPGQTPVISLREHHIDLEKLDLIRLSQVAKMVASAHRSSAGHTMTKAAVIGLVAQAAQKGLVDVGDLKGEMKESVQRRLDQREPT